MKMTLLSISKTAGLSVILGGAVLSSACVSLLPEPAAAPSIYRLSELPVSVAPNIGAPAVRISVPSAPKALQGTDLVVSPDGQRLAYASGARWAEPIPRLLQDAALQALGQRQMITAIAPPTVARGDYALELKIRAFEASFEGNEDAAPLARFRVAATLTELDSRRVIGKREFYAEKRADAVRLRSIVKAQDEITQSVMTEMSDWIVERVAKNPAGS